MAQQQISPGSINAATAFVRFRTIRLGRTFADVSLDALAPSRPRH
jgi:hypothetical protein